MMTNSKKDKIPSILIIDDELINIKVLESLLQKEGYLTFTATSGPEGRMVAQREIPDLILLDIRMKNEDGFETCTRLKEDIKTTDIPIIFISAAGDMGTKIKGLNMGAVDFITKPFEKEEILARTRIHLKLSLIYRSVIEEQTKRLKLIEDAQQAILVQPDEMPGANFAVTYFPYHEAGGDFYDVFSVVEDIYGYFVADISGHDLGASFTTSALKALLKQNCQPLYTPVETLKIINGVLTSLMTEGCHITAGYAHLNRKKKRLTVLSAGHPPVLLLANGQIHPLSAEGDILGVFNPVYFRPVNRKVEKGERFFLYTDGLLERFDTEMRSRDEGLDKLMQHCFDTRGVPLEEAIPEITRRLLPKGAAQEDDLVLMGVEI